MNKLLYGLLLCLLCGSCSLLKGKKEVKGIELEYKNDARVNYGYSFELNTALVHSNGKKKDITSKKELTIEVKGGTYSKGKISINGFPETLQNDTVFAKATYNINEKTYTTEKAIPFNYKGDLIATFGGKSGAGGLDGKNRSASLLFRDGKTGDDGGQGEAGGNGNDLTVYIWKELNKERYHLKLTNLISDKTYHYTYRNSGFGIRFDVTGGQGGTGGDGGDGGNGKDGVISEKKTKSPGDGGNGGNGGAGGTGGTGGTVYIFLHPNAADLKSKIAVYNFGGAGGTGGKPGEGGNGGEPAEGQEAAADGEDGIEGVQGEQGSQGDPFELIIENFDIEN